MSYRILGVAAIIVADCAIAQVPTRPPAPPGPPAPFETSQWLYGSGEGAASSLQAYNGFRDYVLAAARSRPRDSVILADNSTLENPRFTPCAAGSPLAVVLDVDETAIQNLGYQYDRDVRGVGYGPYSWDRWERAGAAAVAPMPGVLDAVRAIRSANVTVIFNSNRLAANSRGNEDALNGAGLGPVVRGTEPRLRTLWLRGDTDNRSGKDARRRAISDHYCVVAMAGDQLGDFSDLFNAPGLSVPDRRRFASSAPFSAMWGNGWFMLSNPVYGPSIAGTRNEVFPEGKRWLDPEGAPVE